MEKVNILEARNSLSKLVSAAERGEEVVIAKRGKPVARLVAIDEDETRHTGESIAAWLATHPVPLRVRRSPIELDQHIADERRGWE